MGWARLDDKRADHPKLMAAGFEARGLDEAAICWSSSHETDGHIPETAVAMLAVGHGCKNWRKVVARLVAVGRWDVVDGGWDVHDFLVYNPSKAEQDASRERTHQVRSEAGRRGGLQSGRSRREANSKQSASPDAEGLLKQNEAPSRPVPSRKGQSPGFTDTHDERDLGHVNGGTGAPHPKTGRDETAAIARRVADLCTADNKTTVIIEAGAVAFWAIRHVDPLLIDEALGWFGTHQPPVLPRAVAKLIRSKAADRQIQMPEFDPNILAQIGRAI